MRDLKLTTEPSGPDASGDSEGERGVSSAPSEPQPGTHEDHAPARAPECQSGDGFIFIPTPEPAAVADTLSKDGRDGTGVGHVDVSHTILLIAMQWRFIARLRLAAAVGFGVAYCGTLLGWPALLFAPPALIGCAGLVMAHVRGVLPVSNRWGCGNAD